VFSFYILYVSGLYSASTLCSPQADFSFSSLFGRGLYSTTISSAIDLYSASHTFSELLVLSLYVILATVLFSAIHSVWKSLLSTSAYFLKQACIQLLYSVGHRTVLNSYILLGPGCINSYIFRKISYSAFTFWLRGSSSQLIILYVTCQSFASHSLSKKPVSNF